MLSASIADGVQTFVLCFLFCLGYLGKLLRDPCCTVTLNSKYLRDERKMSQNVVWKESKIANVPKRKVQVLSDVIASTFKFSRKPATIF